MRALLSVGDLQALLFQQATFYAAAQVLCQLPVITNYCTSRRSSLSCRLAPCLARYPLSSVFPSFCFTFAFEAEPRRGNWKGVLVVWVSVLSLGVVEFLAAFVNKCCWLSACISNSLHAFLSVFFFFSSFLFVPFVGSCWHNENGMITPPNRPYSSFRVFSLSFFFVFLSHRGSFDPDFCAA